MVNVSDIQKLIEGEVYADDANREKYSHDASLFEVVPEAVVFPKTSADISAIVRYASNNKKDIPNLSITMRAAGTCMSGGSINESLILDTTKYMNHIISVTPEEGTAQPGVFYRDFEKRTLALDRIMPTYTASKEINAIGGMVGNNSGGEKSIKYGKIENFIRAQKVIFSDGNEYTVVPLNRSELEQKMNQQDFEGQLYKNLFTLIDSNYDIIQEARPLVSKNSAGYYLWNVWNRETGIFDLNKLLVGSQGTLALTTEVTLGLLPIPKHSKMVVVYMPSIEKLGDIVAQIMQFKPESFESYDDYSMKLAVKFAPDFFTQLGFWGAVKLGVQFIPDALKVLTGGMPKLILMIELTGEDELPLYLWAKKLQKTIRPFKYATHIARSAAEVQKYWKIRRESFNLLRKHVKGKRTAPFIDDIIVVPEKLPTFLPELEKILSEYKLIYTIAGHAGNGNFHIIPLMDLEAPFAAKTILEISDKVYALVHQYKGSITAEHNDGIIRTPYLHYVYDEKILELFAATKHIFDPLNIFNPGKKVGGSTQYIAEHLVKSHNRVHGS